MRLLACSLEFVFSPYAANSRSELLSSWQEVGVFTQDIAVFEISSDCRVLVLCEKQLLALKHFLVLLCLHHLVEVQPALRNRISLVVD